MLCGNEQSCFKLCRSCGRCDSKGKWAKCNSCNGRSTRERPADRDDYCRCTEGIMQLVTKNGRFIQRKFLSDPFAGRVITDAETEDERDWNTYLAEKREQLDDPTYDPIRPYSG